MKVKRMLLSVSLCLIMVTVVFLSGCAGPSSKPSEPTAQIARATILVVPMSGKPATSLKIYGSGFVPGEKVRIILPLEGYEMVMAAQETGGFVVANETGAFVLKPQGGIPLGEVIKPGLYTLKAAGDKGSMATSPLEVVEAKK